MSPRLESERLILRMAGPADGPEIVRFYLENQDHLGPVEPRRAPEFFAVPYWEEQIRAAQADFEADRSLRMWLVAKADPMRPVGSVNRSSAIRGVKQSCTQDHVLTSLTTPSWRAR